MRKVLFSLAAVVSLTGVIMVAARAAEESAAKPKHSIDDVMNNAHKAGLLKKVLSGQASSEEKLTLLDHYISLSENTPPKGSKESWHEKTGLIVMAAAKAAVGREGATELLKETVNCAACHKEHR